jgi:putative ABC transport system permease protein
LRSSSSGVVLGSVAAVAAARMADSVLSGLLFNVESRDPLTLLVVAGVMAGAALLAGYLPARRATRIDPSVALRCE